MDVDSNRAMIGDRLVVLIGIECVVIGEICNEILMTGRLRIIEGMSVQRLKN